MAKLTKFAYVVYSTRRFDEMVHWYQRVFEATVVYQNPAFAFLTYENIIALLSPICLRLRLTALRARTETTRV
ncbi:MAG: hypothetical protein ABR568_08475 [Pyrinomonadaceae bacterium]